MMRNQASHTMGDLRASKSSSASTPPEAERFATPPSATPAPVSAIDPIEGGIADTKQEAVTAKYKEEREKRLRPDGVKQFRETEGELAAFKEDIWAPPLERDAIHAETKVLVVGGGFGGLVAAVNLIKQDVTDFLIVERGSDFGGTWFWNQYPGVTCDVESLIYLPFLEETGYIPKDRFSYGPEIREQVERIVQKWDLRPRSCLQTEITSIKWDESILRWQVRTNRSDHFVAQFVVMATGTLHKPKLPAISGIETFQRPHFHSGRFDYRVTGGDANSPLVKLRDKTVGIIGTGASGVQLVPRIAQDAKKLYVFQRTPSTVTPRENWKNDTSKEYPPGWQQDQMDLFANLMQGENIDRECTALEGLEPLTVRAITKDAEAAGVKVGPETMAELFKAADFKLMEKLRKMVEDTVHDAETAEKLKPWYAFMCKRPAFHNAFYDAFNLPNVELIDTDGRGVSHLTATSVVANNHAYPVDLLIYSTGFEFEVGANLERRTGIQLIGRAGRTLDEKFAANTPPGPSTLFGIHTREFPNYFNIGPAQAGVTANQTHTIHIAAQHIAEVVRCVLDQRHGAVQVIEPTAEAEEEWSKQIEQGAEMRLNFHKQCPPGYYNAEGKPEEIPVRWGAYPKGIVAWGEELKAWREEGSMRGMERR
ncbi:Pentalenolactone D synthase [Pyrenophora seminiperda CCB06]|uniref:Pentalenolactone D synthase n=1 Tax=Pyrenophora seminiperda CCB06 TaxID=1302712 RepID=A0A3M7MB59_9PLEO|nr:Pentalenolactone D synthase [Pyrenophora seminiperda CCB06]